MITETCEHCENLFEINKKRCIPEYAIICPFCFQVTQLSFNQNKKPIIKKLSRYEILDFD